MDYRIESLLNNTLTVGQLRDMLDGVEDDTPVVLVAEYGDYGRTEQALAIEGAEVLSSTQNLARSAYSRSEVCLVSEEEVDFSAVDDERDDEDRDFVAIR